MGELFVTDYGRPEPPAGEQTWTTEQLQADFDVLGFQAPYVIVRRREDGAKGSLEFTHSPRLYFGWVPA